MVWLKKFIAIFAVSFVGVAGKFATFLTKFQPILETTFTIRTSWILCSHLVKVYDRDGKVLDTPPWTIGYASSYAGNLWRKGVMERLYGDYLPKMKAAGILNDIVVTQSNLKDAVQIQQMRQLVDQGVDGLIVCCSNPVALNQTIEYAYGKGVPTASMTGFLTSEYAISTSVNYAMGGYRIATWLAEAIGGEGNVVIMEGIPGASASDSQHAGMKAGFAEYPDITIVAEIAHMWTPQVAQAELQKWLSANTTEVHGFAVQSSGESGALNALESSGRPMVPMSLGGEIGSFCYWRNNPDFIDRAIYAWPPGDEVEFSYSRSHMRQGLKIQSITDVTPYEEMLKLFNHSYQKTVIEIQVNLEQLELRTGQVMII